VVSAHRITGMALSACGLLLVAWLVAAACGTDAYALVYGIFASLPGRLLLVGALVGFWYHLFNGLRHSPGTGRLRQAAAPGRWRRRGAGCDRLDPDAHSPGATWHGAINHTGAGHASANRHASRHWLYSGRLDRPAAPRPVVPFALLALPDLGHASVSAWIARPLQAALVLLFTWCALWHSALGLQVVVEDYVPARRQAATLRVLRLVHWAAAIAAGLAVCQLTLGGAA
jgi:succinate dehydrogenase hydrophobic membrane anchor protein